MSILQAEQNCKKCGKEIWLSANWNTIAYASNHHIEYKEGLCYECAMEENKDEVKSI